MAGSLKLTGGPLHAITWMEMTTFLRHLPWERFTDRIALPKFVGAIFKTIRGQYAEDED